MFKLVRRLHFLKSLTNDGIIFSSGNSNWIQTSRRCSGLLEKKNNLEEVSDDLTFTAFLHQRQQEARRSVIIQISNQEIWDDLFKLCTDCGYINRIFEYQEQDLPFVLIEMASEEKLSDFLKKTNGFHSNYKFNNPFLILRQPPNQSGRAVVKKKSKNVNSKFATKENKTNFAVKDQDNVSESLHKIYTDLSLNDLGVRLRFLMCRQMENFCAGFVPNPVAYPFGSSVTGFGVNGCDLDIALVPVPGDTYYYYQENYLALHRVTIQEHITVLAELMKLFLVGCSGLTLIRSAKVPIVKYKNSFTNVECDLSVYNLHGVAMSQLLYTLSSIDCRVRPLVLALKLWAYNSGLVNKSPGRTVSNFALSLLAVFFLQYNQILPPWNCFPANDGFLIKEDQLKLIVEKYRKKAKEDSKSLGELYQSFFKFYADLDFKKHGICVNTGKFIKNPRRYPLFIENPLMKGLNVSGNVDNDEVKKLHFTFSAVSSKFQKPDSFIHSQNVQQDIKSEVTIGDVRKTVKPPKKPQYIPHKYLSMGELSQNCLRHLRWMLQKDLLKQDMFLIGRPGPTRRQLAMVFLEMTSREVEYVSLSRDTTEADLKQRREIIGGTAKYFDQNAVRAAVEGRVLILEGIEKAERNVLPVLNNLLENREMHLEDGRFLIPASRYDKLLQEHSKEELDKWNLVRVSDDFRVIALGLPVPKYAGNPLDPPLRSRFQARHVLPNSFQEQFSALREAAPGADSEKVTQLLSCAYALTTEDSAGLGLPDFPVDNIPRLGQILSRFPGIETSQLLNRLYPYRSFLNREGHEAVQHIFKTFQVKEVQSSGNKLEEVKCSSLDNKAVCSVSYNSSNVQTEALQMSLTCLIVVEEFQKRRDSYKFQVLCGSLAFEDTLTKYVPTNFQENLIVELLQSHVASDFCLIGPKGCGKSATIFRLANMLNYEVEPIVLYQDITSRDLIQQRNTLPNGDTVWQNSPLIQAALDGKLAVLDGIDRVHPSTLSVIHSLVQDREVQLYDGKRLVRDDRYDEIKKKNDLSDEDMAASGILKIHPSFRIIALAESSKKGVNPSKWLSAEMLSLFLFHEMRPLSYREERDIIEKLYGAPNEKVEKVLNLAVSLRSSDDPTLASLSPFFSTRQLLRISKRLSKYPMDSVHDTIYKACLARFLPPLTKEALDKALTKAGIEPDEQTENSKLVCQVDDKTVKIGNTEVSRYETESKSKVPDILFYDVPQHLALLEWLIQDFTLGEHLLLVGNQGVGKNKIADRLLQLLNRPREYIQLHRDTTVQTLTLQPTVKEGVVSYEDSPLVRAVKNGFVLVVDEADKAPTHVTCILKTLVERGEMTLSDGRKIIPFGDVRAKQAKMIEVHPDFRMIVLANRPGFPFLGNDFFGALGDLFSSHAVDNPSPESEIALLKQYGPDVPDDVILKLVRAFGELRTMADKGAVQYPYSTREVVNIVKHLQNFPGELLTNVISNVFDFDKHSSATLETLIPVLQKNGIPINTNKDNVSLAREYPLPKITKYAMWNIHRIGTDSNTLVEVKNIKLGPKRNLSVSKSALDITEARGSIFSELHSYTSLPMPIGNAVVGLAVIQDQNSPNDYINVLTINPFRLYVASNTSREVKTLGLESLLPRLTHGGKYRFNLTNLSGHLNKTVLIHEENMNHLLLVDIADNSARHLDLTTASEKLLKVFKQPFVGKWKLNAQLADKNTLILYPWRRGQIEVLDLNKMSAYSIEVPLELRSVQVVADGKWLLQNVDYRKYLLVKNKPEDPVPSIFQNVAEYLVDAVNMGVITNSTQTDLDDETLSEALEEKISSPNRLFLADESFAAISVGFPELDSSSNEVYFWPRSKDPRGWTGIQGKSQLLQNGSQIVTPVSKQLAPQNVREQHGTAIAFLEVLNLKRRSLQYVPVPEGSDQSWYVDGSTLGLYLEKTSNDGLVTVDVGGNIRYWETTHLQLQRSLDDWQKLVGTDEGPLRLTIQRDSGKDVTRPKHGKVDPENKPHVGGNTWAGGTGGRDTAGLGGKGGPYRLDAGHDVHQISDYEKSQVPEEVKKAAREMGLRAFKQRLKEIKMSEYDHNMYLSYSTPVAAQVKTLKVIIDNVQRKSKEREWVRHQTTGVLDDLKLIEGLTGERTIFRRRTEKEPEVGAPMMKPKRLKLVADVSGSMLRFNSYDGRLNRMLEASVLVMEAFQDEENKFKYDITGHSGDGYNIPFVEPDKPPKNNKERLEVIKTMYAHSQFCLSGDHTLPATKHAIETLAKEDCDEAIVIVLSDANLERYGIRPSKFSQVLCSNPDVNAYAILIGSLGDQATRLAASLPAGRAFVCLDLSKIPQIMQQIFTASVLSST